MEVGKQDSLLRRNAKLLKSTEPFNSTIEKMMSSKFTKTRLDKIAKREEELRTSDMFVGGYTSGDMDFIEKQKAIPEKKPDQTTSHYILDEIRNTIPKNVTGKQDLVHLKEWSMDLIDTDPLQLTVEATRLSTKSMIFKVTETAKKPYFRFSTPEDNTSERTIQDFKDIVTISKFSIPVTEFAQRKMIRNIDKLICKYRIDDKQSDNTGWSF